jgi:3-hydroxyisobutyrate dehydrogenase
MLKLAYVGGLGMMAGPGAVHLTPVGPAQVVRFHDRGKGGEHRERFRSAWKEHGAAPVAELSDLVGTGDIDGVVVCAGKNGDDLPLIARLASLLSRRCDSRQFILHLSTVSPKFAEASAQFCAELGVDYANYPLTGGPLGAELGGSDPKGMLILAAGDESLYQRLEPMLQRLGHPRYFGQTVSAGSVTKLIGHHLVFNGLNGISAGAAIHAEYFNGGVLGGEAQSDYLAFLNGGAGGTRQWAVALSKGLKDDVWDAGFNNRHAVVDIIYATQLAVEQGLPRFAVQPMINMAYALSYILMEYPGQSLATHTVVREMVRDRAQAIDFFMKGMGAYHEEASVALTNCAASLPPEVRKTVLIDPTVAMFHAAAEQPD